MWAALHVYVQVENEAEFDELDEAISKVLCPETGDNHQCKREWSMVGSLSPANAGSSDDDDYAVCYKCGEWKMTRHV